MNQEGSKDRNTADEQMNRQTDVEHITNILQHVSVSDIKVQSKQTINGSIVNCVDTENAAFHLCINPPD